MTPALAKRRDEMAHASRDRSDVLNEDWNSFHAFKMGFDECAAIHADLVQVSQDWLSFEEGCIKRDGPYCSPAIPNLMARMKSALESLEVK